MRQLQHRGCPGAGKRVGGLGLALLAAALSAAAAAPPPLIVAFGDSLTASPGVPAAAAYPAGLQRRLRQAGYRDRVLSLGVSGDTTTDGLARLDAVLRLHPAWVILELGGNDGLRGLPVSATEANLARILARLQAARIRVLLVGITLPPNYGPRYIHAFTAIYPALARRFHLPLLPSLYQDLIPRLRDDPNLLQADGIHPTAAGDRIVAATVWRALRPLLGPAGKDAR